MQKMFLDGTSQLSIMVWSTILEIYKTNFQREIKTSNNIILTDNNRPVGEDK